LAEKIEAPHFTKAIIWCAYNLLCIYTYTTNAEKEIGGFIWQF